MKELSQPSSIEVEEIIHQLVQNILQRFFKDDASNNFKGHSIFTNAENLEEVNNENCHSIDTSRDYLAKLLFWYVVDFVLQTSPPLHHLSLLCTICFYMFIILQHFPPIALGSQVLNLSSSRHTCSCMCVHMY